MKLFIIITIVINFLIPINAVRVNENLFLYDMLALSDLYQSGKDYHIKDELNYYFVDSSNMSYLKIFPVYDTNELIGFIIEDANGNYSIGAYYADVLNSIIDVNSDFELIFHNDQVFVIQGLLIHNISNASLGKPIIKPYVLSIMDYGNEIMNLPYKSMNSSVDCWAACMAAIIQFKGTYITTSSVVSQTGNYNMASIQNVSSYLSNIYHVNNNLYTYSLGFNNAMTHIGNNHPIIAACDRIGTGSGHMVIIKGVYYLTSGNNDAMYKLMDPYSSATVNVITTTSSNLSFVSYGGNTYQWTSSIVIS